MKGGGGKDGSEARPTTPTTHGNGNATATTTTTKASLIWGNLGHHGKPSPPSPPSNRLFHVPKLMFWLLLILCLVYLIYTLNLLSSSLLRNSLPCSNPIDIADNDLVRLSSSNASLLRHPAIAKAHAGKNSSNGSYPSHRSPPGADPTGLKHIVFGIAASASLWDRRKDYIKLWWRPGDMRGFVWLDKPVKGMGLAASLGAGLPEMKISGDTSKFPYTHKKGHRSAIRISRIVSETYRLGLPQVRWFVMGDDDTIFLPDNLAAVLNRFDHRQPYYIGALSESHLQNIYFSYGMAYGGGGFAISRPLAAALAGMQDRCLHRYPALYGSDDRIQACMSELGVPLTRHPGFHQYDVYGDLLGLLAAHPVAPLVSLHHLDVVQPIFPASASRAAALRKLFDGPVRLDSAGVMQQSICYEHPHMWTVSVSWGFVVMVVRGVMSPREMEMPARTFLNWYKRADYTAYAFNTRPVARSPCQRPYVFYLASARYEDGNRTTVTEYQRRRETHPQCRWKMADPSDYLDRIVVYKKPDPNLWSRSPRRNCCRVLSSPKDSNRGNRKMVINVGVCKEGEVSEI